MRNASVDSLICMKKLKWLKWQWAKWPDRLVVTEASVAPQICARLYARANIDLTIYFQWYMIFPSTARRLWWLHQSQNFDGLVFEDSHRSKVCVCAFVELSVHLLWVSKLYCVIKKYRKEVKIKPSMARTRGAQRNHWT